MAQLRTLVKVMDSLLSGSHPQDVLSAQAWGTKDFVVLKSCH